MFDYSDYRHLFFEEKGEGRKYSGPKDTRIGRYGKNGMTGEVSDSSFSDKEKSEAGLTLREKL